jgi:phosphohistidine phosphatase
MAGIEELSYYRNRRRGPHRASLREESVKESRRRRFPLPKDSRMNLYLIRHAEAVDLEEGDARDDAERPLTAAGKAQCATLAAALQARGVVLNQLVSSPLLRARETAEAVLAGWPAPTPEQLTCNGLAPGGKAKKVVRFLLGLSGENVALVGHQPDLGEFLGWLIGAKKAKIEIAKAGAALVRFDASPAKGEGALEWLVTSEWCEGGAGK